MGGGLEGPDGSDVARCGTWAGRSTLDICEMGMLDHDHFGGLLKNKGSKQCVSDTSFVVLIVGGSRLAVPGGVLCVKQVSAFKLLMIY